MLTLWLPIAGWAQSYNLSGQVLSKDTQKPIGQVVVELPQHGLWAVADNEGWFTIKNVPQGKMQVATSCLGYVTTLTEVDVKRGMTKLKLYMMEDNLTLESVVVTAKERPDAMSTSRTIGSKAIDHLQMVNASDIASLLPGGKTVNPNLMEDNPFTLRAGGSSAGNAAFGTAVEVDGVRLSTNGSFGEVSGASTRNIASTNIEEVEVITGVPSAEYGDISSGMVRLKTRKGKTPYMMTFSTNLHTKQVSASKGFDLGGRGGTLNSSVEYTRATNNPVSPYTSYSRTGISLHYRNTFAEKLRFDFGITGNIGGMDSEDDPDAENGEWQRTEDNALRINTALKWQLNKKWITNIDFKASLNYSDKFDRQCTHPTSGSTLQAVHALTKGYFFADILPTNYFTYRNIDSRQLDYAADIKATWIRSWDRIHSHAKVGVAWRADGNVGDGEYYDDPKLSPSGYRPYPYTNIPYMHNLAFYAEELLTLPIGNTSLQLMAGVRGEKTYIKNTEYKNTTSWSPRLNAKYRITDWITVRGGWGLTEKLPSLGVLYPRPQYRDVSSFEKRYGESGTFLYYTEPYSMSYNPDLKWQRNRNAEIGIDLTFGNFSMSVVGYFNRTTNPYDMISYYDPFSYRQSMLPSGQHLPDNPLFKVDHQTGELFMRDGNDPSNGWNMLPSKMVRTFSRNSMQSNGSPVDRKGLEVVMQFPRINPLRTEIRFDGSYNYTKFVNTGESQYLTSIITGDQAYPYVGIYPNNGGVSNATYNGERTQRIDANLTATTHIPSIRLVVSLRVEASFLRRQQRISEWEGEEYAFNVDKEGSTPTGGSIYNGNSYTAMWPIAYLDLDGVRHPFTDREKADPAFASMLLRSTNIYQYRQSDYSPYFSANLSITKEIGDHVSISFYANNFTNSRKFVRPYAEGVGAIFTPEFYYGLTVRVKF